VPWSKNSKSASWRAAAGDGRNIDRAPCRHCAGAALQLRLSLMSNDCFLRTSRGSQNLAVAFVSLPIRRALQRAPFLRERLAVGRHFHGHGLMVALPCSRASSTFLAHSFRTVSHTGIEASYSARSVRWSQSCTDRLQFLSQLPYQALATGVDGRRRVTCKAGGGVVEFDCCFRAPSPSFLSRNLLYVVEVYNLRKR